LSKPTAIFVLGMHRSGTSALAGALAASGVWLGDDLLEPAPGVNDKGFWEHKDLVKINEALLEFAGLHWYSPLAAGKFAAFLEAGSADLDTLKGQAREFVSKLLEGAVEEGGEKRGDGDLCVAIKDPRLCLTANFWLPIFEEAGARVVGFELVRHPAEVGRSLARRDGIVSSHSNVLWLDHVLASVDFCRQLDGCYAGSFDDLMASPLGFTEVALKDLGIGLQPDQEKMEQWIQEDLRHHKRDTRTPDGLLADEVTLLYEEILQRRSVDRVTAEKLVNHVSGVFEDLEKLFEGFNATVVQLQDVSERLDHLGKEHSRAQEVIQERDKQLATANSEREKVAVLHQKALDTIAEKDVTLESLAELGDNHHHALQVVAERDRQLEVMNQRIARIESSIIGKLLRVRGAFRRLAGVGETADQEVPEAPARAGETSFPEPGKRPAVDVIIPVYGGFEETCAAVKTAASSLDSTWARLVVINDCSPEPAITQWLRDNHAALGYELLENDKNLGFVGTVNRGMRLRPDADVLLLNSDVEVANDWLERLQDCAYSRDKVASVTATANNATICSFPVFCEDNELPTGFDVQSLDEVFRRAVPANMAVEIPSGIGCCMYMRRDVMDAIGLFDEETFGRGYGEENDWCQCAIKHGGHNLHALNVFIYHKGAVSFAEESDSRKEKNLQILARRYPSYHFDVQAFIKSDPALHWRTRVMCEVLASSGRPKILAISHGMGGGVVTHIQELERELTEVDFVLLEPVGDGVVQVLLVPLKANRSPTLRFHLDEQYDAFLNFCKAIGICHVHFHHTMGLPTRVWGLALDLGLEYDYTLHDFWVINGNPTLTGKNGVYAGDGPDRDRICAERSPLPDGVSAEQWRNLQVPLLRDARFVIAPSADTRGRIAQEGAFHSITNWRVSPHLDHGELPNSVSEFSINNRSIRVVVLGALSQEKGADILEAVAQRLSGSPIEFHLLGYGYRPLSKEVITHGAYREYEALERLFELEPDVVWFTAQWPETYSYTLSLALKACVPVVAPNLGAFPERLALRRRTLLLDDWSDTTRMADFWLSVRRDSRVINDAIADGVRVSDISLGFYHADYLNGLAVSKNTDSHDCLKALWSSGALESGAILYGGRKEYLLTLLIRLRRMPIFSSFVALVPFSWQRRIKRFLSRRPIHDIEGP